MNTDDLNIYLNHEDLKHLNYFTYEDDYSEKDDDFNPDTSINCHIGMEVIGGFIAAIGVVGVTLAMTVLSGGLGAPIAMGLGLLALIAGLSIFCLGFAGHCALSCMASDEDEEFSFSLS